MSIMSNVTKYNINARHKLCLINQMYNNVHRVINRIFRNFSRWKGWLIYPNLGGEEDDCSASSPFISGRNSCLKNVWTQSLKKSEKSHWTLSWLCWPSRDPLLILQKFFKQTHRDSDCPYMRSYLGLTLYILYHVWKLTKNKKKLSED